MTASVDCVEVLIAEADPWTANLLQQLVLDVCGDARVLQVSDGQAALARCKRRLPDLVIADGELPGLDGLELLPPAPGCLSNLLISTVAGGTVRNGVEPVIRFTGEDVLQLCLQQAGATTAGGAGGTS